MENIKKFTRNANFGSKELLMRIQLVFLMSIIALCSCGSTTPTNAQVVLASDMKITKSDLFHQVNSIYSHYPEFESESILRENDTFYTYCMLVLKGYNKQMAEDLKSKNMDLYHSFVAIRMKNKEESLNYLKENNLDLYHHALYQTTSNSESLDYLKTNSPLLYNQVLAYPKWDKNEYLDNLKP